MRSKLPARIDVVRKEEKEAHLVAFVRADLEAAQVRGSSATREYTLVIRSTRSPAAQAMMALGPDLAAAHISLRLVVVQTTVGGDANLFHAEGAGILAMAREVRALRDIRFLDAHEQLWLDASTAWFGDSMRREPGKRDAYECYATDNVDLARWAERSFELLWRQAEPLAIAPATAMPEAALDDQTDLCAAALAQGGEPGPAEASTRH